MTARIIPVPLSGPRLGIIASAVPAENSNAQIVADGRWLDGIKWIPEPCDTGLEFSFDVCTTAAFDSDPNATTRDHTPTGIGVGVECSTAGSLSTDELTERARRALGAHEERMIGDELWNGTRSVAASLGNRYLKDANATIITAGTDPTNGLAALEQYAATNGAGGRAFIHARPKLVTYWQAYNLVRREGNLLLTALDSVVVPSEGYDGTGPSGQTAPDATHDWAYVTGTVQLWRDEVQVLGPALTQITGTNHRVIFATRITAAVFDPCVHGAIRVTLS